MIARTLSALSFFSSDYLRRTFNVDEDIVCLQPLFNLSRSSPDNKIHLSLVNVERETAGGIQFNKTSISGSYAQKGAPSWMLNLYIMFAAVFSEKQYEESLQLLSALFAFLQTNSKFTIPQSNITFNMEPVNLSFNELSNLWSINGSNYFPSVLCKVRVLDIDSEEIKQLQRVVSQKEVNT
ncbi:Pvc16 family protein [Dysgonomonas termitidis]|uniref:DUF4255 domain-containing protein n=1 Tax=Dysgonomonas termitidis TaxID=1516126 RepID=A0ABV9KUZ3_9BACT